MNLKNRDWIILIAIMLITIIPSIIGIFDWGQKNYFMIVFFAGFIPIYTTHTTSIGLRFRNFQFSLIWLLIITINGLLYSQVIHLWLSIFVSFIFYHLLRLIFKVINKEDPIPMFVGPGMGLDYNKTENRMENKRDALFTMISFIGGIFLAVYILMLTKFK